MEWVEEEGVVRGGCWGGDASYLRVSDRGQYFASLRGLNLGFRCVRDGS